MSGGPIKFDSCIPVTSDRTFPYVYIGAGANSKHEEGLGIEASLGADSIWRLRAELPPSLPSGTCKLRLIALANATSGSAKVNPKWASVAVTVGEDPSSATLQAEGTQTLTWAAGGADKYTELKVTLDADTPVAGEIIVMDLTFETSGWTLAQISCWKPSIIWE